MNITLFGSSFNPPHLGHALVIQDFLEHNHADQLWLLPNYQHTFGKNMASPKHRLAMTRLFLDFIQTSLPPLQSAIHLCPIEIDLQLSGETIDTLHALQTTDYVSTHMNFPSDYDRQSATFSFLMGSDQLPSFHRWGNYQQLLKHMTFYVYPRSGYPNTPLLQGMHLLESPTQVVTNISSTLIRQKISSRQNLSLLLPPDIISYIHTHQLY